MRYSLKEFLTYLATFVGKVEFTHVHCHATWRPTIADYRRAADKMSLIENMWRYHTVQCGWSDIAQHITIDPDGFIWLGRSLLRAPASSTGFNDSDDDRIHPFMFEMIGDFDVNKEKLDGPQLATAVEVTAAVIKLWKHTTDQVIFHREISDKGKTCPGSSISKPWFIGLVNATIERAESPKPTATDNIKVVVNDKLVAYGRVKNGHVYLPIRKLGEALGYTVEWRAKEATPYIDGKVIRTFEIIDGMTYVGVRAPKLAAWWQSVMERRSKEGIFL